MCVSTSLFYTNACAEEVLKMTCIIIIIINIHLYRPFLQDLQRAKHEYKRQNQTTSYATENKYCSKSFFKLVYILILLSLKVIGGEFQTLEPEDQKLRGQSDKFWTEAKRRRYA